MLRHSWLSRKFFKYSLDLHTSVFSVWGVRLDIPHLTKFYRAHWMQNTYESQAISCSVLQINLKIN